MNEPKPYFRHLYAWIYESAEYKALRPAARWFLHLLSGAADETIKGGSRRGARLGGTLLQVAGMDRGTAYRYVTEFERAGFIVKLDQGGGKGLANEYGIPAERGAIDPLAIGADPRFQTRETVSRRDGMERDTLAQRNGMNETPKPPNPRAARHKPSRSATHTVAQRSANPRALQPLHHQHKQNHTVEHQAEPVQFSSFLVDDDRAACSTLEPPDHATEQEIAKALNAHGVGIRRANVLARKLRPDQAREAINLAEQHSPSNRGAYIAELAQGLLDTEAADRAAAQAEQHRHVAEQLASMAQRIESMLDAELAEVIAHHCQRTGLPPDGYTPEFVRGSRIWRETMAQELAIIEAREQAEAQA